MATEESVPTAHEDDRKLFVGALPQEAKDTDIKEYFETYGEVESINLKIDNMTGRSRGFAFLVFKTVEGIEAALQQEAHVVKVKIESFLRIFVRVATKIFRRFYVIGQEPGFTDPVTSMKQPTTN